jgi:hypothetical protein
LRIATQWAKLAPIDLGGNQMVRMDGATIAFINNAVLIFQCALFVGFAVIMFAARRWLLAQSWSMIFWFFGSYGVIVMGTFWPDALGGQSVGGLITHAWMLVMVVVVPIFLVRELRR